MTPLVLERLPSGRCMTMNCCTRAYDINKRNGGGGGGGGGSAFDFGTMDNLNAVEK